MGVLMCGISVSALFAIATRLVEAEDPGLGESQNLPTTVLVPATEFENSEKIAIGHGS